MALQTSGPISLNDIHIEAGGSSGTNCTLNDTDIRGLISKASGATMSFNEWYGASGELGTWTITEGTDAGMYSAATGYSKYAGSGGGNGVAHGSISPNPATFVDGNSYTRTIGALDRVAASGYAALELNMDGNLLYTPNLFTSLEINLNGTDYSFTYATCGVGFNSTVNATKFKWSTNEGFFSSGSQAHTDLKAQFDGNGTTTFTLL